MSEYSQFLDRLRREGASEISFQGILNPDYYVGTSTDMIAYAENGKEIIYFDEKYPDSLSNGIMYDVKYVKDAVYFKIKRKE